jgi:hypothetical protein
MCDDNLVRKRYGTGRVERAATKTHLNTEKIVIILMTNSVRVYFLLFQRFLSSEKRC